MSAFIFIALTVGVLMLISERVSYFLVFGLPNLRAKGKVRAGSRWRERGSDRTVWVVGAVNDYTNSVYIHIEGAPDFGLVCRTAYLLEQRMEVT